MTKSTGGIWMGLLFLLASPAWSQEAALQWDDLPTVAQREQDMVLDVRFDDGPQMNQRRVERPAPEALPDFSLRAEHVASDGSSDASTGEAEEELEAPTEDSSERVSSTAVSVARSTIQDLDWDDIFKPVPRSGRAASTTIAIPPRDPHSGLDQQMTFVWAPRVLAHRTLYFEDMPLERYGQSCGCLQPLVSSFKFFADVATVPLQKIYEKPCELHYILPLDRPGACSPSLRQPVVPYVPK